MRERADQAKSGRVGAVSRLYREERGVDLVFGHSALHSRCYGAIPRLYREKGSLDLVFGCSALHSRCNALHL